MSNSYLFFIYSLAQSVKLMIAIAIFLTYALQFYVPMEVIWKNVKGNFSADNRNAAEYTIRILLVVSTYWIKIPNSKTKEQPKIHGLMN